MVLSFRVLYGVSSPLVGVVGELGSGGVWPSKDSDGLAWDGAGNYRRLKIEGLQAEEEAMVTIMEMAVAVEMAATALYIG
ncbi:hypothetical protein SLEP1_g3164 [Rubroshorea leprosula]|uniref:Uncharacterized protein n=1 Tax=Rubroshorea leprosula TaxID=152421 RepID=A0AAV5HUX1_9ROSI|nr:hypothetical protein SLEP1_g3164 [Rubroshorea leprosula]